MNPVEVRHSLRASLDRYGIKDVPRKTPGCHIIVRRQPMPSVELVVDLLPGTEREAMLAGVASALYSAGYEWKTANDGHRRHYFIKGRRSGAEIPEDVPVCEECGRVLTDPTSIARGKGPECAAKEPFPL